MFILKVVTVTNLDDDTPMQGSRNVITVNSRLHPNLDAASLPATNVLPVPGVIVLK